MGLEIDYIDGQTPLDEDEKEGLLIKSITTRGELDEFEQLNIEKAIQWTLGKKWGKEYILSEKFVRELHRKMYGDVCSWAGQLENRIKVLGRKKIK
jgi:fido (protein-threonine AMPylation protein)